MITLEELNALPEIGTLGYREELIDGKRVVYPMALNMMALHHEPDDPLLIRDEQGRAWSIGTAGGVRYKRRIPNRDA